MDQQQQLNELKSRLAVLQGQQSEQARTDQPVEPAAPEPVDPALAERRNNFTGAQRRLADGLSRGQRQYNLIDSNRSDASAVSDKLVILQITRLMLNPDGNDGILYAVMNWNSKSQQSLADRIGDHASKDECNPQWRLGMQSAEWQRAYGKRQTEIMKVPYVEPRPELKLDAKALVRMSSQEFAEFVVEFHRQVLQWELKAYIYANVATPAKKFFDGFVRLQREADAKEEALYKGAMAAHILATDPALGEEEAQDFLDILAWMGQRERLEAARRAERIAKQKQRTAMDSKPVVPASEAPAAGTIREDINIKAVERYYDHQIEKIKEEQDRLKQQSQQEPLTV